MFPSDYSRFTKLYIHFSQNLIKICCRFSWSWLHQLHGLPRVSNVSIYLAPKLRWWWCWCCHDPRVTGVLPATTGHASRSGLLGCVTPCLSCHEIRLLWIILHCTDYLLSSPHSLTFFIQFWTSHYHYDTWIMFPFQFIQYLVIRYII